MDNNQKTPKHSTSLSTTDIDSSQPIGQLFKEARKKKGLSLDNVVEQTHILKRHLEALENNDFEALPQLTFARGFAVNYGKFLGLDGHTISQIFDAQYPSALKHKNNIPTAITSSDTLERDNHNSAKFNPFIFIGIIVASLLAYFIFTTVNKAHKANQSDNTPPAVVSPQEQITGASLNNNGVVTISPNASLVASTSLPTSGSAISPPASVLPATTPPTTVTASVATASTINPTQVKTGSDKLDFWVKKPTTIQVTDATGQVILQGVHNRGGINLTGTAPFTINIDNVTNVSVDFNKQPIKLGQYAQNNQANFTLKNP